jgi:NAD dependent epimerase/dehydratase family enzyme
VAKPIKFYAGAALGSGNQYISWIHIHDLAGMFIKAVFDEQMRGIYNGVAPHPESNKTITNAMAKRLHRPILLPPVPTFAMKIIFGEMASMLIANQYIDSKKIEQTGFNFQYPSLDNALDELMGK